MEHLIRRKKGHRRLGNDVKLLNHTSEVTYCQGVSVIEENL